MADTDTDDAGETHEMRECVYCRTVKPCRRMADPFIAEIRGPEFPNPPAWWCDECYLNRKMDA